MAAWIHNKGFIVHTIANLTPCLNRNSTSDFNPPGLSLTNTVSLTSLPSAANPRSRQRPNTVVSMLPPHKRTTTLTIQIQPCM